MARRGVAKGHTISPPVVVREPTPRRSPAMDSDLPFEEFVDSENVREITSSKTFRDGEWQQLTRLRGFSEGVHKRVVPVDLRPFRTLVITEVEPGTKVEPHAHDEPILRYVMSGSFILDGETYVAGEWVLVPKGIAYGIETTEGYVTIAGYGVACDKK
jgi:quercetin dioxygenase-like cupin family protein